MNSVKLQNTNSIHRNLLHFSTLTTKDLKEKLRKQYHHIKENKIPGIHSPKEAKDLCSENSQTLMKETKDIEKM